MPENNTQPFERLQLLAGTDHVAQMGKRHAMVLGLGGVGSYVVEALVRGGIGHITVVDPDCSASGNINRQLYALHPDIGQPKVELAARRCRDINPQVHITTLQLSYSDATAAYILAHPADCVFDCIDTISAKIDLIERCVNAQIPLISSMGAGNKKDPTQIKVDDIFATTTCRLARIIRKELRRRGVHAAVPVVYSTEEFRPLHHAPAQRRTGSDWCKVPLGTCSYIPPLFGYMMAGHILQQWIRHDMPAA
ncbi:MAG: tRNA threonylcarbamoyladenosine dehydratase [Desulfuromonadaceae bacterium]|nr:tRNA threonylcarbamoyladenosine dehydratase [Desulfuromonadaceae bacterium]